MSALGNSLRRRLALSSKRYNTFIGNVADVIPNAFELAEMSDDLTASDIFNFETDSNNNIRCFINKDYSFTSQFFGGTPAINSGRVNMNYFIDLDGKVFSTLGFNFANGNNRFIYLPKISNVGNNSFRQISGENIIVMPELTSLGNTLENDGVFTGTNGDFYLNKFLETANNGNPDGDIKPVTIYRDLNNTAQTTPPPATTISANTIGSTFVELDLMLPTHVNDLKYVLVFLNGFVEDMYDINNVLIFALPPQTSYNIKVIIADEFFNISTFSNTINVTTTTTPALFQDIKAFYPLKEISGDAIELINGFNGQVNGNPTRTGDGYIFSDTSSPIDEIIIPDPQGNLSPIGNSPFSVYFEAVFTQNNDGRVMGKISNFNNASEWTILDLDGTIRFEIIDSGNFFNDRVRIVINTPQHGVRQKILYTWNGDPTDSNGMKCYLNKVDATIETTTVDSSFLVTNQNTNLYIGRNEVQTASNRRFNGLISRPVITKKYIEPSEVSDFFDEVENYI